MYYIDCVDWLFVSVNNISHLIATPGRKSYDTARTALITNSGVHDSRLPQSFYSQGERKGV